MTISPTLSEQFSALVNLAVVTNVVPYIIALSALMVMMRSAGVPEGKYRLNTAIATVGMLYSVFAIYASGKDAVLGGMLVTGIGFIIWGFLAPRFATRRRPAAGRCERLKFVWEVHAPCPSHLRKRAGRVCGSGRSRSP